MRSIKCEFERPHPTHPPPPPPPTAPPLTHNVVTGPQWFIFHLFKTAAPANTVSHIDRERQLCRLFSCGRLPPEVCAPLDPRAWAWGALVEQVRGWHRDLCWDFLLMWEIPARCRQRSVPHSILRRDPGVRWLSKFGDDIGTSVGIFCWQIFYPTGHICNSIVKFYPKCCPNHEEAVHSISSKILYLCRRSSLLCWWADEEVLIQVTW